MPKTIRKPSGTPFKRNESPEATPPFYGNMPNDAEIRRRIESQMAAEMYESPDLEAERNHQDEEIDERQLFMQQMMEFLPIFERFKNIKDLETIMQLAGPIAAKALVHCMMFGDNKIRESAASKILDRVIGKPVERQLSITGDIHRMSEQEMDNDIIRIVNKLGIEEVAKTFGAGRKGSDPEGNEKG